MQIPLVHINESLRQIFLKFSDFETCLQLLFIKCRHSWDSMVTDQPQRGASKLCWRNFKAKQYSPPPQTLFQLTGSRNRRGESTFPLSSLHNHEVAHIFLAAYSRQGCVPARKVTLSKKTMVSIYSGWGVTSRMLGKIPSLPTLLLGLELLSKGGGADYTHCSDVIN